MRRIMSREDWFETDLESRGTHPFGAPSSSGDDDSSSSSFASTMTTAAASHLFERGKQSVGWFGSNRCTT